MTGRFNVAMMRGLRHRLHVRFVRVVECGADAAIARRLMQEREYFERRLDTMMDHVCTELDQLRDALYAREVRDRRDIIAAGERAAVASSARFVEEAMVGARTFPTPTETLAYALSLAPSGGMALEFGVYSGTTLAIIADARAGVRVYGFDAFEGLPEDWRAGFGRGTFAVEQLPQVSGAELVIGWFSETLPNFLASHSGSVDFLHLDADLYSSAATVLEEVGPRLRPGSVVIFDEYFNHPGWENGEHRAWTEYARRSGMHFRYEAFTHDHEQVVVIVTGRAVSPL